MLPFSKRKNQSDELELDEDDFEVVELSNEHPTLQRAAERPRPRTIVPVSRRILAEEVEEDVAGQCLASIAAETSQTWRDGGDASSAHIRAALAIVPRQPSALDEATLHSSVSRLPSVSAPPLPRTTAGQVPGVRESSPPPAFVRRSSPKLTAIPAAAPSSYVAVAAAVAGAKGEEKSSASSVAPVSMPLSQRAEPTIIVVRERPRAAWIFAAAAIGALGSFGATRILSTSPSPASASVASSPASTSDVAPPSTAVASTAVVVPPSVASAPVASAPAASAPLAAASPPPAIVHFGDDDGVAIKSPATVAPARRPASSAPAATTAPAGAATTRSSAPRVPSMGPALPDGSFGLGRSDTSTTSSASAPAPALTASAVGPADARRRALTPEQQLAAAQLKASMK